MGGAAFKLYRARQPIIVLEAEGTSITTNCAIRVQVAGSSPTESGSSMTTPKYIATGGLGRISGTYLCAWRKLEANLRRWWLVFGDEGQPLEVEARLRRWWSACGDGANLQR
uniref:Uncharacterized protein n=1 Tax=Cannabis sativa TaxID=3483 RepID=A0A803QI61_CANSA